MTSRIEGARAVDWKYLKRSTSADIPNNVLVTRAAMAKLERLVISNEPATKTERVESFSTGNEVATEEADTNPAAIQ